MQLYPGDILQPPPPADPRVRFRVREIETVTQFGPWMKSSWPVRQYVLQLYTMGSPGRWSWQSRDHDRRGTMETIESWGLVMVEPAKTQLELFSK